MCAIIDIYNYFVVIKTLIAKHCTENHIVNCLIRRNNYNTFVNEEALKIMKKCLPYSIDIFHSKQFGLP